MKNKSTNTVKDGKRYPHLSRRVYRNEAEPGFVCAVHSCLQATVAELEQFSRSNGKAFYGKPTTSALGKMLGNAAKGSQIDFL